MLGTLKEFHGHSIRTVEAVIGQVKNLYLANETWVVRYPVTAHGTASSTAAGQSSRDHTPCQL